MRFHEISSRFAAAQISQHLLTTPGGRDMTKTLGCKLQTSVIPASLFLRREPCRAFRLWSYLLSALFWRTRKATLPKSDILITVSDYFCDIFPALSLKRHTGAKWIAWIHHCETNPKERPGNRLVNELMYRLQRWSFRQIAAHADSAWINDTLAGDEIERRLLTLGMSQNRIRRMQNGIDFPALASAPRADPPETDAVMIGVRPNKGLHDILPIWEKVVALRPGTTLTLMGGMSGESELIKEIAARKLPITIFKPEGGFLVANAYHTKIKTAHLLFAPSHEEGWGIAVCEAMAAGLPVIAYDLPAYQKIYRGAYRPIPCFDHDAFARAIVETLNDAEEQARLRTLGTACAAQYDWTMISAADRAAL